MGRPHVSEVARAPATDRLPEDPVQIAAKRRAVVFGLTLSLISALLVIGAIASLVVAFD